MLAGWARHHVNDGSVCLLSFRLLPVCLWQQTREDGKRQRLSSLLFSLFPSQFIGSFVENTKTERNALFTQKWPFFSSLIFLLKRYGEDSTVLTSIHKTQKIRRIHFFRLSRLDFGELKKKPPNFKFKSHFYDRVWRRGRLPNVSNFTKAKKKKT